MHLIESKRRFTDTKGLAEYTGRPKSFYDKRRVYGGGPKFRKVGSRVIYDLADVDAWLAECAFTTTSEYPR
jgi:hypothetical protein